MSRTILHVDLDAFFVSVELLDRPELRGLPVAVGGRPDQRGVIAAASYEARAFGVHSAQPTRTALQLCPTLILLTGRHGVYSQHSERVMALLQEFSPEIEPISIDEAFLDVTGTERLHGPPEQLAWRLHDRIRDEARLPCSIGVASNKLVAKIATERAKPNNVCLVPLGQEAQFLAPLPVRALWGVGPKTAEALAALGIESIGQVVEVPADLLESRLGRHGAEDLIRRAQGLDDSPVESEHAAKQFSQETTFARDVRQATRLRATLLELSDAVGRRLRGAGLSARTVAVKIRYGDYTTFSRQTTLARPTDLDQEIAEVAWGLFSTHWDHRAIRLLGVAGRQLTPTARQLDLFDARDDKLERLDHALDDLRRRYGPEAVRRGSTLDR
ncbi:MAG: DNA polymerase IV [Candidatus Latescibacterota bacterium]|jgi:DNA polymerase-4